jgi:excisionase family DNA binding protein
MAKQAMTLQEAADSLGVHYMTVYRYVRTGRLAATRSGGTWRVDPADLALVRPGATAHRRPPASSDARPVPSPTATPTGLGARLLAGDEHGAWSLLESALASGRTPSEVLLEQVAPAMVDIGSRWEQGSLTVADEHQASAVASRLISRIGARFIRRGRKRGTVIVCAPPGEHHGTPVAIAADLLRWNGFGVVELGADTPADALSMTAARTSRLLAIGLACSTPAACASARRTIAALRRAPPVVPILVGGAAVTDADHAARLGADHYSGRSGDQLVLAVETIAAGSRRGS